VDKDAAGRNILRLGFAIAPRQRHGQMQRKPHRAAKIIVDIVFHSRENSFQPGKWKITKVSRVK
jgi:hypothetical protein